MGAGDGWAGVLVNVDQAPNLDNRFKLQVVRDEDQGPARYPGQMPRVVNIRTDRHPQSILDCNTLKFEGGTFDWSKTYGAHRRFIVKYCVEKESQTPYVAFESCLNGKYLGVDANGQLQMVEANPSDPSVHWIFQKANHFWAWTPGQVAAGAALPVLFAGGAAVGFAGAGGLLLAAAEVADTACLAAATHLVGGFFGDSGSDYFVG